MHALKLWFSRILISLLLLILIANLYFPIMARLTGKPHPALFGYRPAIILTGSMEPTIQVGDLVLFKTHPNYREGEVILYEDGRHLVTHRITKSSADHLITQGDANNTPDAPMQPERVLGSMIFRLPKIGRLTWFFKTPAGFAVLGVLMMAIGLRPRWGKTTAKVDQSINTMGDNAIDR